MCNKVYNPFYILTLAGMISLSGCKEHYDPLNPETSDLPEAAFTLSAVETRGTDVEFPWAISKSGKTDSVNEEIDDMYVTHYNKLTLAVNGTGAGYKGVNVESSDPKAVQVQELAAGSYALVYVRDGEADITVWNGAKRKSSTKVTFHVNAIKEIPPKEVLFIYDEGTKREKIVKAKLWVDNEKDFRELWEQHHYVPERRILGRDDYSLLWVRGQEETEDLDPELGCTIHTMRYLKVEPENVSFRKIKFTTEHWEKWFVDTELWYPWLAEHGYKFDWSAYEGDFGDMHKNTYFIYHTWCNYGYRMSWCEIRFLSNGNLKYATILCSASYYPES